jgi:hypothetical protein
MYRAMTGLAQRVNAGERISLMCWCAPLPCHCDHIADGVRRLAAGIDIQAEARQSMAMRAEARLRQAGLALEVEAPAASRRRAP